MTNEGTKLRRILSMLMQDFYDNRALVVSPLHAQYMMGIAEQLGMDTIDLQWINKLARCEASAKQAKSSTAVGLSDVMECST